MADCIRPQKVRSKWTKTVGQPKFLGEIWYCPPISGLKENLKLWIIQNYFFDWYLIHNSYMCYLLNIYCTYSCVSKQLWHEEHSLNIKQYLPILKSHFPEYSIIYVNAENFEWLLLFLNLFLFSAESLMSKQNFVSHI